MSPKELLYIEDALAHEKQMCEACDSFAKELNAPELRKFAENLAKKHKDSFQRFYSLLK